MRRADSSTASAYPQRPGTGVLGMIAVLAAVPLVGFAIAFPLWYAATQFRTLYTAAVIAVLLMGIIRHAILRHFRNR